MTVVDVDRLRLRCDVGRREPTRFALEDALRTELPDDGRLVVLRRLQVAAGGSSTLPARRQAAMREAWAAATGGACHGGEDRAASANCVWFASQAEAERLLLDRLLRGRATDGWFWKLALPDWRGRPVQDWLPELLAQTGAPGGEDRLLALVDACVGGDAADVLATALERAAAYPTLVSGGHGMTAPGRPSAQPAPSEAASHAASSRAAELALVALAPPIHAWLRRLTAVPEARASVRAILKALLTRTSPALSLASPMLERAVGEALRLLVDGPAAVPRAEPHHGRETAAGRSEPGASAGVVSQSPSKRPAGKTLATPHDAQRCDAREPATPAHPATLAPDRTAVEETLPLPLYSRHAGLWLVVPALGDMGLRDWLACHPELLGEHPGACLMLAIARHHRVPAEDPAVAVLGETRSQVPPPAWARQWRHGLDRWLRRKARRRLHDLVHRPGRILRGDQRLDLAYPLADADIRLRRLALDRDPGWTDWLGLSIRYRFGGPDDP